MPTFDVVSKVDRAEILRGRGKQRDDRTAGNTRAGSSAGGMAATQTQKMFSAVLEGSTRSKSEEMSTTSEPAMTKSELMMNITSSTSRTSMSGVTFISQDTGFSTRRGAPESSSSSSS